MINIFNEFKEFFVPLSIVGIMILILSSDVLGKWLDKLINGGKDDNDPKV